MQDAFVGVIIGAVVGLVPSFLTLINAQKQRNHDLRMKRIEILESERISVLLEFLKQFGALFSCGHDLDEYSLSRYFAAGERASALVSEDTRNVIERANLFAASSLPRQVNERAASDAEIRAIVASAFFNELSKPFKD